MTRGYEHERREAMNNNIHINVRYPSLLEYGGRLKAESISVSMNAGRVSVRIEDSTNELGYNDLRRASLTIAPDLLKAIVRCVDSVTEDGIYRIAELTTPIELS